MSKHPMQWLALILLLVGQATAHDLSKAPPWTTKLEYEDADIRVIRLHCEPGASSPMHSHPPRVLIFLEPATLRLSKRDGSSSMIPADQQARPTALDAETDAETNIGTKPGEYIEVEFKRHAHLGTLRTSPLESSANPKSLLHEPHHHWLMGTSWFRVVEARIPPGETTLWHRHSYSMVVVQVSGGEVSTQNQGGKWSQPEHVPSGTVEFAKVRSPFVHRVRNNGSGEYRVDLVEMLRRGQSGGAKKDKR